MPWTGRRRRIYCCRTRSLRRGWRTFGKIGRAEIDDFSARRGGSVNYRGGPAQRGSV